MAARLMLFLSSYAPLFGILALRFDPPWLRISCAGLALAGCLVLAVLLRMERRVVIGLHDLEEVRDAGAEAAAYLAAYLLPFVTVGDPDFRDLAGYGVFLLVAAAIHTRSPVIQVNPLLYLFGFRVLRVRDSEGMEAYLVTREMHSAGDRVRATTWSDGVLLQARDK